MYKPLIVGSLLLSAAIIVGCTSRKSENKAGADAAESAAVSAKYLVDQEPAEPKDVNVVVDSGVDKERVTVLGRIGGDARPFVQDMAAFMIVDRKLKACSEMEDDHCDTPWDFCCESGLSKNSMTVKFVDDKGQVVPIDAKLLFQLKELQTVVVTGELQKSQDGNVALVADKLYVRK